MNNYAYKVKHHKIGYLYFNTNDELHRLDGPAVEFTEEYYVDGTLIPKELFNKVSKVDEYKKTKLIKDLINED